MAKKLSDEILTHYGLCDRLHSDQGCGFESSVVKELCRLWGVRKTRATPFYPQSSGLVERSR
ncbi:MAG: transposase family protein [Desulfobulbaceae bacterium]|nr:transposase family protein [Desulfobulbaceae bacterium]